MRDFKAWTVPFPIFVDVLINMASDFVPDAKERSGDPSFVLVFSNFDWIFFVYLIISLVYLVFFFVLCNSPSLSPLFRANFVASP